MNGAERIVAALRGHGVEVVFGLPGVHNLALWEALSHSSIRLIGTRHEQGAAYAADGYARATGRLGVAITTTGPGAANTLGAVGEAWASRTPILVIATDIATTLRRPGEYRGVLHETVGQEDLFRPVTKSVYAVSSLSELNDSFTGIFDDLRTAPVRPVYLQVPTDLLAAAVTPTGTWRVDSWAWDDSVNGDLRAARALVAQAKSPLIWAGGGCVQVVADDPPPPGVTDPSGAEEVRGLAEHLDAPVITTYTARGLIGDHDLAVGLPPHLEECGELWDRADLVIAVGTDFDGMMTQNWSQPAPKALLSINVEPATNYAPTVELLGDAAAAIPELLDGLPERRDPAIREDLAARRARARERLEAEQPQAFQLLDALDDLLPEDAVVAADMCIPGYWYAAVGHVRAARRLAYPVGWGTLGFGFPASMGTAAANALGHCGPAVCLTGDGGFLFNAGELATLQQEQLPLTVVLVDDGGYGMLRYDQKHAGQEVFGTELATPDFTALAGAFGITATRVDGFGDDFRAALAEHLETTAPTILVVDAHLDPPPTTSPRWYRRR